LTPFCKLVHQIPLWSLEELLYIHFRVPKLRSRYSVEAWLEVQDMETSTRGGGP